MDNLIDEYKKCLEDPVYFIENYCTVNGKSIKLKDYQKAFIKYIIKHNERNKRIRSCRRSRIS